MDLTLKLKPQEMALDLRQAKTKQYPDEFKVAATINKLQEMFITATLNKEKEVEKLDISLMTKEAGMQPDESDEGEGDDGSDSDNNDNEHMAWHINVGRRKKADRGRGRPNSARGRGKNQKKSFERDPSDDDEIDFHINYKRKEKDQWEACPPPAPEKMKGGRKTLLKKAMKAKDAESVVQKTCAALKNKVLLEEVDPKLPLKPYTGFICSGMQRELYLSDQRHNNYRAILQEGGLQHPISELVMTLQKRKQEDDIYPGFDAFTELLKREQLSYAVQCARFGRQLNPKTWLIDLAKADERGQLPEAPIFSMDIADEVNEGDLTPAIMRGLLNCARNKVDLQVCQLINSVTKVWSSIQKTKVFLDDLLRQKFMMQLTLTKMYEELTHLEPKFDETSVSGIRHVKLALEIPFIKAESGLVSFNLPMEDYVNLNCNLPFRYDKQKWTTKDLRALKRIIRDDVLTRTIEELDGRYFELLYDSDKQRVAEMTAEGVPDEFIYQAPTKCRRGRPTREETKQRNKYGVIHPILFRYDAPEGQFLVNYNVAPKKLSDWRTSRERRYRGMGFTHLMNEATYVDWKDVANKLMISTRKLRLPLDCQLAYEHEVCPQVITKRWTYEESEKLKQLYLKHGNDWDKITKELNINHVLAFQQSAVAKRNPELKPPVRTPYQVFFRFRNKIQPPVKPIFTEAMDNAVLKGLKEYSVHWRKIAATIQDESVTKKVVVERYKKSITPVLRLGSFHRAEDCLLLLTIEKLKPFLECEGHFGSLLAYLPWRYETTWRDRATNLFNDWIVPWTIEEDRLLLKLAVDMKRNWQKISEQFTSFKNRKGCLTRYKILQQKVKMDDDDNDDDDDEFNSSKKYATLEEYHESYVMTRYNVFQYRHLKEILALLHKVQKTNIDPTEYPFHGLPCDRPPTDAELGHMLLMYDKEIIKSTIKSLGLYVQTRDAYWKNWLKKHGKPKRTFDRRKFHPHNPKSVASAIHIRGLKLVPKDQIADLNEFEEDIYIYYARFCKTKALREDLERPYLPSGHNLGNMSLIRRIIAKSENAIMENTDESSITKGKSLSHANMAQQDKPKRQYKQKIENKTQDVGTTKKRQYKRKNEDQTPDEGTTKKRQYRQENDDMAPDEGTTKKRHKRKIEDMTPNVGTTKKRQYKIKIEDMTPDEGTTKKRQYKLKIKEKKTPDERITKKRQYKLKTEDMTTDEGSTKKRQYMQKIKEKKTPGAEATKKRQYKQKIEDMTPDEGTTKKRQYKQNTKEKKTPDEGTTKKRQYRLKIGDLTPDEGTTKKRQYKLKIEDLTPDEGTTKKQQYNKKIKEKKTPGAETTKKRQYKQKIETMAPDEGITKKRQYKQKIKENKTPDVETTKKRQYKQKIETMAPDEGITKKRQYKQKIETMAPDEGITKKRQYKQKIKENKTPDVETTKKRQYKQKIEAMAPDEGTTKKGQYKQKIKEKKTPDEGTTKKRQYKPKIADKTNEETSTAKQQYKRKIENKTPDEGTTKKRQYKGKI